MRKLLLSIILGLSLALGGCGGAFSVHNPAATNQTVVQKTREAINQAYATHAAVTETLLQNYHDGIITKAEKDAYAVRTRQFLNDIDHADVLLAAGDINSANSVLELEKSLILVLQQELARQAAKEKQ